MGIPLDRNITQFVQVEDAIQKDSKEHRFMQQQQIEFDQFCLMRDYVLKNLTYLKGKQVPVDVDTITHLPSHNCIILNDLLLLPYSEVFQMIKNIKNATKKDDVIEVDSDEIDLFTKGNSTDAGC